MPDLAPRTATGRSRSPDSAAAAHKEAERAFARRGAFFMLDRRTRIFAALKVEALDRLALAREVEAIGRDAAPAKEDTR